MPNKKQAKRRYQKADDGPLEDEPPAPPEEEEEEVLEELENDIEEKAEDDNGSSEDESENGDDTDEDAVMEKAVKAIDKLNTELQQVRKENHQMRQVLGKVVPPEMDVEWPDGQEPEAAQFNPYAEELRQGSDLDEGDTNVSDDSNTDAGTDWSEVPNEHIPKGEQGKAGLQKSLDEMVEKRVEKRLGDIDERVEKAVEARTPRPYGYNDSEEAQLARRDPAAFVRKAIQVDREACGGAYNNKEGRFGFKTGVGDDRARTRTALFIRKALD